MPVTYRIAVKIQALVAVLLLAAFPAAAKKFDGNAIGKLETVTVEKDERLMDIAQKHGVGYAQLLAANPAVDPWLPRAGTKLKLPEWHILPDTAREGLVLNTAELRLYYYPPDGSKPKTFPIGIGREGLHTPKGTTTITRKAKSPVWRPTPRMRLEDPELPAEVKPGPDNPLGAYALYLGWPSYLIHGTNKPKAIGRRASSGCIRMYEDHIEWLYKNVPVGAKVTSVHQPIKMAWIDGELYLEAEPNNIQVDELEYQNRQITIDVPNGALADIRRKAGKQAARVNWEIVRTALIERTGIPVQITDGKPDDEPLDKIAGKK